MATVGLLAVLMTSVLAFSIVTCPVDQELAANDRWYMASCPINKVSKVQCSSRGATSDRAPVAVS
jgi:hypothetical protein